jgi:hypothetical protein
VRIAITISQIAAAASTIAADLIEIFGAWWAIINGQPGRLTVTLP